MAKLTTEEFIEKAKLVHGDYYDYSLVDYKGENYKISIICPINGVLTQNPRHHLSGFKPKNKRKENELIFINRAKEKHGDKYDYSLVDYKTNKIKVKIICPEHGIFEQKPPNHINTNGCVKCNAAPIKVKKEKTLVNGRLIYVRENARLTQEEFLKKAKEIHGDKYDYSKINYQGASSNILIICPVHKEFEQRASSHIGKQKYGCRKCSSEQRKTGLDNFLNKAFQVHGDKFDYSLVTEYKTSREHVNVICKKHGAFKVTCDKHINRGQGCPKCKSLNLDGFIEKSKEVHGDKYDYSKVIYTNNKAKVDIICPIHGIFSQRVSEHISKKSGCLECSLEAVRMSVDDFIYKANKKHDNKYFYDKDLINFKNNKEKVSIFCPNHGVFIQKVNSHLCGSGCPSCKESKGERFISNYLKKEKIKFKKQYKFDDCRNILPLPFDFYLLEYNMCIEFNGKQHYEPIEMFGGEKMFISQQKRDEIKMEYCKNNNIPLIIIKYDEDLTQALNNLLNRITTII